MQLVATAAAAAVTEIMAEQRTVFVENRPDSHDAIIQEQLFTF